MGLRERKKEEVRRRILSVCAALFRDRGFDETSIDLIAEKSDISRPTFFNYFPGKDSVLAELGLQWLAEQSTVPLAGARKARSGPVLVAMRAAIAAQARAIEADADFVRLVVTRSRIFGASAGRDADRLRERIDRMFEAVADVIRAGQAGGEIATDFGAREAAELLVSSMFMTVRLWAVGRGSGSRFLEHRLMRALDLLEHGLRSR